MKTEKKYGSLPVDLGEVNISPEEMMFWMYCPIKKPGMDITIIPDNLMQFVEIVKKVEQDIINTYSAEYWLNHFVYITAKNIWVSSENPGNRPGWHSDGFLSEDLNYVWSDKNPTVFWNADELVSFTSDHNISLNEMNEVAEDNVSNHKRYNNKHLLRLDETVIHKVDTKIVPGMRCFVKISVSKFPYTLKGNSINHLLPLDAEYEVRSDIRNCPIGSNKT